MNIKLESPKELAARLGWPVRRIRMLISANQLRHIRIGSTLHIPDGAIEEFLQSNMVQPTDHYGDAKVTTSHTGSPIGGNQ